MVYDNVLPSSLDAIFLSLILPLLMLNISSLSFTVITHMCDSAQ